MNNAPKTDDETGRGEKGREFIVYFLDNGEDQGVHVEEAEEVDLSKVIPHLDSGGSVFIARRRKPQTNIVSEGDVSQKNRMV